MSITREAGKIEKGILFCLLKSQDGKVNRFDKLPGMQSVHSVTV